LSCSTFAKILPPISFSQTPVRAVYTTNAGANTVSVINQVTNTVTVGASSVNSAAF
jgi:DNA-binding beta-propeller fold protein YncE